ncbi:peptide chain release factor N(5)-glutamine methyltransferase [Helicobacter himalayensis]|uniref:peptide chain release factor N(5)-glutamine methyltransferase n=1 Tax=Helicobacter himalayensis TaxID=1591088 RepID=UPI003D6DBC56
MTIACALQKAKVLLNNAPFVKKDFSLNPALPKPRVGLESELLLSCVLGQERIFLHTFGEKLLSKKQENEFFALINRRANGEPIEYLTGKVSFYGEEFFIESDVLIPRPESEILIDKVQVLLMQTQMQEIFEVGVGSGIIALTLARLNPKLRIYASDINQKALALSAKNSAHFGLDSQITLFYGSLLEPFLVNLGAQKLKGALIVSNPPYIANDYPLSTSLWFEPQNALFGGERGSEILEALILESKRVDARVLVCEMGYDQKAFLSAFIARIAHKKLEFYKDLSGLDRGFVLEFF